MPETKLPVKNMLETKLSVKDMLEMKLPVKDMLKYQHTFVNWHVIDYLTHLQSNMLWLLYCLWAWDDSNIHFQKDICLFQNLIDIVLLI